MSAALKSQSGLALMCALGIAAFPPAGFGQSVAGGDTASAAAVEATARTAGAHKNTAPALNEAQRHQVWQAVMARPTDDKLPAGFEPAVGTKVPSQKKLPLHPLPRPLVTQVPALKQYYYAKLPDKVPGSSGTDLLRICRWLIWKGDASRAGASGVLASSS